MNLKTSIFFFFIILLKFNCFAQTPKKTLQTKFSSEKITIDGKFDEEIWKTANIATDFSMLEPDNGKPASKERQTEVKIVYDNSAIYVAATMYDEEASKQRKELTQRDNFATAEHFGVLLNGYNDGQQEFRFFVSSAGVQIDILYTETNGEDFSYNAIWDSNVQLTDKGWTVEMKIPYAALRFSSEKKQTWGLNFYREFQRDRQQYSWNLIDNKISNEAIQAGILEGIEDIETPTRLFFIPYSSFYLNGNEFKKTKGEIKGGLDIKYGINDAFTLDAILVPDFGQTAFDNVELNLGPFEQQFGENRPFFTEGTELFSKGDLVYSRRIGGSPSTEANLANDETYLKNPKVNLLNALKISGRTKNGLGIGVLNAVTDKTYAEIQNTVTGEERKELVEPLANYNVFVLDQRFRKNSSVSFINTNVTRNGEYRDGNVTAALFDLNTKKNTFNLSGDYKYSIVNDLGIDKNKTGYNATLNFSERSGKIRYGFGGEYFSRDFDKNDLGILFQTHYHSVYANASYRILNPTKKFNSFGVYFNSYSEFDNLSGRIQGSNLNLQCNFSTKKNDFFNFGLNGRPFDTYDFYEPRTDGETKFFTIPKSINSFLYFSSNYARRFAIDVNPSFGFINEKNRVNYGFYVGPRYRVSDKIAVNYDFNFYRQNNNVGYITTTATDEIIFARRNRITYTNTFRGKYTLNNTMNLNLSIRHYWSYAINNGFLTLQDNGSVISNSTYTANRNSNFNTWNMDLSYSWWFAPGSQVSVLYRNNSAVFEREFERDISTNFKKSLNHENLDHIFSISVRYFIDYNSLKRKK